MRPCAAKAREGSDNFIAFISKYCPANNPSERNIRHVLQPV